MGPPPNEVYNTFSFIGFLMCAIPFYWHMEGVWSFSGGRNIWSENALYSLEYRHLFINGLGWCRVSYAVY